MEVDISAVKVMRHIFMSWWDDMECAVRGDQSSECAVWRRDGTALCPVAGFRSALLPHAIRPK